MLADLGALGGYGKGPRGSSGRSSLSYAKELAVAIEAARHAGEILRRDFHRRGGPRGSGGHAEADEEAERAIRDKLLSASDWRILGEELGRANDGGDAKHIWLVDPNDGTRAYLRGMRGSAVSIGALRDGLPILGVVYAFCYPGDVGTLVSWAEGEELRLNGEPVSHDLAGLQLVRNAVVIVSQDADHAPGANARCVAPGRFLITPSIALRLALVAVGEGVAATSLNAPGAWDYCAGHALLRATGGVLVDQDGHEVTYAPDGTSHTSRCFGGAPAVVQELARRPWHEVFVRGERQEHFFPEARLEPGRAVEDPEILSRAHGCLLGLLVGDALGSAVEFKSAETIGATYPGGVRELVDGGTWNTLAGQPTDDGELGLMLARSLVMEHGFDQGAPLDAYVHWYRSGPFDCGNTIGLALRTAATGRTRPERLRRAAEVASKMSQANGSLMRIAPLGIFGWRDPQQAARWAREDSALTHPHEAPVEACAAFVAGIATAIGKKAGPREVYEAALSEARQVGCRAVIDSLVEAEHAPPARFDGRDAGWVLLALQNAFYRLLHVERFEEALVATIAGGGDTDSTAAICAALLGAVHGRDAIPVRWRRLVLTCRPISEVEAVHPRPREFWPVDALELAERLLLAGET
jgi:ADP-ribosylglycohydrolase/fructose-1,6-bisphosphatase/inositol monophosphatase family enzyme